MLLVICTPTAQPSNKEAHRPALTAFATKRERFVEMAFRSRRRIDVVLAQAMGIEAGATIFPNELANDRACIITYREPQPCITVNSWCQDSGNWRHTGRRRNGMKGDYGAARSSTGIGS